MFFRFFKNDLARSYSEKNNKTFFRDQSGAFVILFAFLLVPLIAAVGFAVDSARGFSVRSHLQASLDAAALVGIKYYDNNQQQRDQMIHDYFYANWRANYQNSRSIPDADLHIVSNYVDPATGQGMKLLVSATVEVPTVLMRIFNATYAGASQANLLKVGGRSGTELPDVDTTFEVALALDTTASMNTRMSSGQRRIDSMKQRAKEFVNQLFMAQGALTDVSDVVNVSVVPFTSVVNIGTQHQGFLADNSLNNIVWDFPKNSTSYNSWRGCTFERAYYEDGSGYQGNDMTDASPDTEKFWPYHVNYPQVPTFQTCPAAPIQSGQSCTQTCDTNDYVTVQQDCTYYLDGIAHPRTCPYRYCRNPQWTCTGAAGQTGNSRWVEPGDHHPWEYAGVKNTSATGYPECPVTDQQNPPLVTHGFTNVQGTQFTEYPSSPGLDVKPYAVYQDTNGFYTVHPTEVNNYLVFYLGANSTFTGSYFYPALKNMSALANRNVNNTSVCCYPTTGYNIGPSSIDGRTIKWSRGGRWIYPWPTNNGAANIKFGGYGNSGCGLPLLPLTNKRLDILASIDKIDVIDYVKKHEDYPDGQGSTYYYDIASYNGTIINEGLVWGWRTISSKWKNKWKFESGTAINSDLPRSEDLRSNVKAVVVLTDGLNNIQTVEPSSGAGPSDLSNSSFPLWEKYMVSADVSYNTDTSTSVKRNMVDADASAYGYMVDTTTRNARRQFCLVRKQLLIDTPARSSEVILNTWGCRDVDCMIRNSSGQCKQQSDSAGFGTYYDTLEEKLKTTCLSMRAKNIHPFFILFDVDGSSYKDRLMNTLNTCIGTTGGVYSADNSSALSDAFAAIALSIRRLRLSL